MIIVRAKLAERETTKRREKILFTGYLFSAAEALKYFKSKSVKFY